ncbi:4-oxalocrotonate decarboxylase [Thermomicrobium sp. 4228-Ro]|uniref:2-keto-4-pentenoate hydratase n=1 Tax=Thermomicrobium sp. 4228-Ro TaxID=2993937 RepID=UPI002248B735|nr:4-oxalocrotonate decarboxylase [Thermomicrobium sp. 4228-Ro]MCX2726610.1 4-oxalocrotonate decarboxylase [Thermomicrobium sp. 4228-Ro]
MARAMLSEAEKKLLEAIRAARQERRPRLPLAEELGVDLAGAYRVQEASFAGQEIIGYKLGLVSPAKQAQMGVSSPIYGRITRSMLREGVFSLGEFVQPRIEPELAVVLRESIPAGAPPGRVALAIGAVFLGIDLLDSVWEGYRFSAADVIADNASGGAFLLGDRALPWPLDGDLALFLDGERIASGPLAALEPITTHLAWLATAVGGLEAGQLVYLGSPAAAVPARPGVLELRGPCGSLLLARLEA